MTKRLVMLTDEEIDRILAWRDVADLDDEEDAEVVAILKEARLT